jgi:hypothetical protein
MAVEGSIYQNIGGMAAADTMGAKYSVALHLNSCSTAENALAAIAIDAGHVGDNEFGFWNGILLDKAMWWDAGAASAGAAGTVAINMGSFDAAAHPQYGIKFGKSYAHIYAPTQADSLAILSDKSIFNYIQAGESFVVRSGNPGSPVDLLVVNPAGELLLDTDNSKKVYFAGNDLMFYDATAGAKTLSELAAGGGTVNTSGTPVDNDFAKFTDADTIEGRSYSETRSDLGLVIGTTVQAQNAVLTDLAAISIVADNEFIVGSGAGTYSHQSGATARTSLGLGTAATRAAEDSMTDGSSLPDGHAIKVYGDANWSGGGTLTTIKEAGVQVGGADIVTLDFGAGFDLTETPNTEVNVALDLTEYSNNYGSDSYTAKMFLNDAAPSGTCLWRSPGGGNDISFNSGAQAGGSILEARESSLSPGQAVVYLERDITGTSSTNFSLNPGCIYAETRTYNAQDRHDVGLTIMGIAENASINTTLANNGGYDDAVGVAGRGSKSGGGYGDVCGVWGSAYRVSSAGPTYGGVMGVEACIYENRAHRAMSGDRPHPVSPPSWSVGLHVYNDSSFRPTAGVFIDANHTKAGYLNAILIDKESFDGAGVSGTVGIKIILSMVLSLENLMPTYSHRLKQIALLYYLKNQSSTILLRQVKTL